MDEWGPRWQFVFAQNYKGKIVQIFLRLQNLQIFPLQSCFEEPRKEPRASLLTNNVDHSDWKLNTKVNLQDTTRWSKIRSRYVEQQFRRTLFMQTFPFLCPLKNLHSQKLTYKLEPFCFALLILECSLFLLSSIISLKV